MDKKYKRITVDKKVVFEHRIVMENFLNRKLDSNEEVHHLNNNKVDNRIENLIVLSKVDHAKLHGYYYWTKHERPSVKKCLVCGGEYPYVSKYGKKWFERSKFCSMKCNLINARNHNSKYLKGQE